MLTWLLLCLPLAFAADKGAFATWVDRLPHPSTELDVADEVVSCDPTRNALISRLDNSNDETDTRRLARLDSKSPCR